MVSRENLFKMMMSSLRHPIPHLVYVCPSMTAMSSESSPEALPDIKAGEEEAIISAVNLILGAKMANSEDTATFKNILRDVFPNSVRPKSGGSGQ